MSKHQDPELEAKLAGIADRIRSVDHDAFKGDCERFRDAIMALIPPEDMDLLVSSDPLLGNLCCLFMQAGESFMLDRLSRGMARAAATGESFNLPGGRVSVVGMSSRRRAKKDDGPKKPPTA